MLTSKFISTLFGPTLLLAIAIAGLGAIAENHDCKNASSAIFNLSWEMHEEFNKTKSAQTVMDKFGPEFQKKTEELERLFKKDPECKTSFDKGIGSEARRNLKELIAALPAKDNGKKASTNGPEVVSYDEWFTLQKAGIKSGKKYSFIGCVIGPRNATAIRCHIPGTAAKRVFYNLDDIQDQEMKRKWVNANNKEMCITGYVTGGEAFVISIADPDKCK